MKRILLLASLALFCAGCGYQDPKEPGSRNGTYRVELYSGGNKIGEWLTGHKPTAYLEKDSIYFIRSGTGEWICVHGDFIVTQVH